jgi:hypothetical protein
MRASALAPLVFASCACVYGHAQAQQPGSIASQPIRQSSFRLSEPEALPVGDHGSFVSGNIACGEDGTIYVQVIHPPIPGASPYGSIMLYAVRGATDIVQFHPEQAPGYRQISPIARYFATDSKVVALAYGIGIDHGDVDTVPSRHAASVLLVFDRRGALSFSKALDLSLHPEQIGLFPTGEILLVAGDESQERMHLVVLSSEGNVERELPVENSDPGQKFSVTTLTGIEVRPYGQNLMLVSDDISRPILEVGPTGVVNRYSLHLPKGYNDGMPVSFKPFSWKFGAILDTPETPAAPPSKGDAAPNASASSPVGSQLPRVALLEFDPPTGTVTRQFNLPSGFQPACEDQHGDFTLITAGASDGKLQIAKATPQGD